MHNRDMAHRHPSLPDVCETCRFLTAYEPPEPDYALIDTVGDSGGVLPVIAAGVALAMLLAGFAWLVLAAFR